MQQLLLFVLSLSLSLTATAQIGVNRKSLHKEYGPPESFFELEDGRQGENYDWNKIDPEADFIITRTFIFPSEAEDAVCIHWMNLITYSDINLYVEHFNTNFIKVGELEWIDYSNGMKLRYQIAIAEEGFAFVHCALQSM